MLKVVATIICTPIAVLEFILKLVFGVLVLVSGVIIAILWPVFKYVKQPYCINNLVDFGFKYQFNQWNYPITSKVYFAYTY